MGLPDIEIGESKVDSRMIADHFSKGHNDVLKDIRREISRSPDYAKHFVKSYYKDSTGRKLPLYILTEKSKEILYKRYYFKINNKRTLQRSFDQMITTCLKGLIKFETEFKVDKYRLDFYNQDFNLAVEYDEDHHRFLTDSDLKRQYHIEKKLGCKFIRVKEGKELEGLNQIVKFLFERGLINGTN